MPIPVTLASSEEEERRTWVTQHHEVVRLAKDCFGDRFSNNEIFDRLKISRRTGYRALGNDERIGKAPGRKPKIAEAIIREMIDYIENGGCNDVGNVWKHLAEKFAPDCNPKTVQDAVKKSGFKNYRSTVKLEPLLNEMIPDGQSTPLEDQQAQQIAQLQHEGSLHVHAHAQAQVQPRVPEQQQQQAIDPVFQQTTSEALRNAIGGAHDQHVRFVLHEICSRYSDAASLATSFLCSFPQPVPAPSIQHMQVMQMEDSLQEHQIPIQQISGRSKLRLAVCRRCGRHYDRAENTMKTRECLYHKGSPQKISPSTQGTIEHVPEAYIWSCCGGNGLVQGCCRAMHTTKKKRKYGKKRDATTAGLDGEDSGVEDTTFDTLALHSGGFDGTSMHADVLQGALVDDGLDALHSTNLHTDALHTGGMHHGALDEINPNIDASLQSLPLQPQRLSPQLSMGLAQNHLHMMGAPHQAHMQQHHQIFHNSLHGTPMQTTAQLPPEMHLQIANA